MQILHLFNEYNYEHLDIMQTIDSAMELLPVSVHRLVTRYTDDVISLLSSWYISTPAATPAVLLIAGDRSMYLYPDMYDDGEQMVSSILDFFEVEY